MSGEPNPSAERQNRPARRHWNAAVRSHWLEFILGIGLLAVGAAQVFIYLRQANIMQTQADIAVKQNEITIAVNRAVVNFHNMGQKTDAVAGHYDYSFKLGNDGSVSTDGLSLRLDCKKTNKAENEPFDCWLLAKPMSFRI